MSNESPRQPKGLAISFTAKMTILAIVVVIGLVATATLGILRMRELATKYDALIANEEMAQETGMDAQVEFRLQVQEWKNILIRGHNPEKLAKHTKGFEEHKAAALAKCDELEAILAKVGDKEASEKTVEFRAEMDALSKLYAAGLANFTASGGTDVAGTDKMLDGKDKEPTRVLKEANERIHALILASQERLTRLTAETTRALVISSAAILIVTIMICILIVGGIRKTLNGIAGAVSKMGAGDFTTEIKPSAVRDEIGRTVESVIQMQHNTRDLIRSVHEAATAVDAASRELLRNADETANATKVVATAIQDVATDAQSTGQSVGYAQQNLSQNHQALDGVSRDIVDIAQYANQASNRGEQGRQHAGVAAQKIQAASASVMETAAIVRSLGQRTAEIDQFIAIITGIADQTNLLALNAAIEAARAGDAGRGFAVVAEEVRKLAEESSQAASSITQRIKGIQDEMVNAEQAMQRSDNEVKSGASLVDEAANMLAEIVSGVEQLDAKVQNISAAVEELNASSSEIVDTIDAVALSARSNVDRSNDVSSAAQQQLANVESIETSTRSLSDLSAGLLSTVARFAV